MFCIDSKLRPRLLHANSPCEPQRSTHLALQTGVDDPLGFHFQACPDLPLNSLATGLLYLQAATHF